MRTVDLFTSLEVYQGEGKSLVFTVVDENGAAIDITGATVTWRLAKIAAAGSLLEKTVGSGIVLTTPGSGILTVTLDAADTSGRVAGEYIQELTVTLSAVPSKSQGPFIIKPALKAVA